MRPRKSDALPRISVVMPAYNRAGMIGAAVESVLAQEFSNFELIVVDDGSTDGTPDILGGYRDPRVRVIRHDKNGGSNAARNTGIRNAKAELIAFLDSDDVYLPHKLRTVVRRFDEQPELDVLVDSYAKLTSPLARRPYLSQRNAVTQSTEEFARKLFRQEMWKATSAITVRRDAAIRAGMFSEDVRQRQDMEFLIRLTEVANCGTSDEILWVKTWVSERITSRKQFVPSTIDMVRRHPQYLDNPDYRFGLSRSLFRHFFLLLRERSYAPAVTDLKLLSRELGPARTLGLAAGAVRVLFARALRRQARSRKPPPPEMAEELAKVRSRVSAHS